MKINKILLVSIILLTIFAIGAVSASDDVNGTDDAILADNTDVQDIQADADEDDKQYTEVVITIPEDDFEIGEDDTIDIGYPLKDKGGILTVKINGKDAGLKYDKEDFNIYVYIDGTGAKGLVLPVVGDDQDEDEYSISLDKLSPGTYNVEVNYKVGSITHSKSATIKLNPEGYISEDVIVDVEDTYIYGNSANQIAITAPDDKIGSLVIKINGVKYTPSKKSNGQYYINISSFDLGEYEVVISYDGEDSEETFEVVNNIDYPETVVCGESYYVALTLYETAEGNLTVKVDNNLIGNEKLVNGKARILLPDLSIGYHAIEATYTGDDFDIEDVEDLIEVIPKIIVPTVMTAGENKYLTIYTGSSRGTLTIETDFDEDGPYAVVNIRDSTTSVSLANLDDGEITMNVIFEDNEKNRWLDEDYHIQVNSVPVRIVGTRNIQMVYDSGTVYKFTVYGTNSRPADTEDFIEIYIGSEDYDVDIGANGVTSFKIPNSVAPGTYKIKIIYDDKVFENTLTIKHLLKLKKVNVKRNAKKIVLKASLKKGMNKKKIIFKFKKDKFVAYTNPSGVAKVVLGTKTLDKIRKDKKVTYQATYLKDTVTKTVKIQN